MLEFVPEIVMAASVVIHGDDPDDPFDLEEES